jgi:hypothetical protein
MKEGIRGGTQGEGRNKEKEETRGGRNNDRWNGRRKKQ